MPFDSALELAKEKAGISFDLKPEQIRALRALYDCHDVMCLLPTGFGKSVIFQLAPFLLDSTPMSGITLVIAPLNSIMKDQVMKLCRSGISACYIDMDCEEGETFLLSSVNQETEEDDWQTDDEEDEEQLDLLQVNVPITDLMSGKYNLIYAHPEALLTSSTGMNLMRSKVYQNRVCCIAIDEGHMIHEWGDEFRRDFKRLQELLALFPAVPTVVLTATASTEVQRELIRDLCLRNPVTVAAHPDRPNIKYVKKERLPSRRMEEDLDSILGEMVAELRVLKSDYPLTIMYTDLEGIRYSYRFFEHNLGNDQYNGDPDPDNRIFAQYHCLYTEDMKDFIVKELGKPAPTIRVVFATVALGMGLDAKSVRRIIHFKSPTSIAKYLQETGRAGRDGLPSTAVLYYNKTDIRKNRPGQQRSMTAYCRSEGQCLRHELLTHLGYSAPPAHRLCECCNVCEAVCQCEMCV